tara:strand:+ start:355 stop:1455 length:1101 start_codon:yes stop_codon:yes gene_type:complete
MALFFTVFSGLYLSLVAWAYFNKSINVIIFCFFCSILSSVFATYLSHDALAYQGLFNFFSKTSFSELYHEIFFIELFFLLSLKLLSFLPVFLYIFLCVMLSFYIKIFLIERSSRNPLISVLCLFSFFFLYFEGTVIRLSLGLSFCYIGIYFLSKERFYVFFSIVLFSSLLFHYSLLVLLIMPFFRGKFSINIIITFIFIFMILYFFDIGVFDFFLWSFGYMDSNFIGLNKLGNYLNNSERSYPYSTVLVILFLISLFFYICGKGFLNDFELICYNMLFISFLIVVVFYESQIIQNRISEIFRYSLVFVFPFFYEMTSKVIKNTRVTFFAFCLFFVSYYFYYYYYKDLVNAHNIEIFYNTIVDILSK